MESYLYSTHDYLFCLTFLLENYIFRIGGCWVSIIRHFRLHENTSASSSINQKNPLVLQELYQIYEIVT